MIVKEWANGRNLLIGERINRHLGSERQRGPHNFGGIMASLVCARCVTPIKGEQLKVGSYTYCQDCVEKEPKWKQKVGETTEDGINTWVNVGKS